MAGLARFAIPAIVGAALLGGVGYAAWHFTRTAAPAAFASSWPLVVTKDGKCGAIDANGQFTIKPSYEGMTDFNGKDMVAFRRGSLWGYLDKTGKEVIEPRFDIAWDFDANGLAMVMTGGSWGFIDKTGQFAIQPQFEFVRNFDEERGAWVMQAGQWGRIDSTGKFIIPPKYNDVGSFAFGAAPVMLGKKWGLIDPAGQFLIQPRFAMLGSPSAEGLIAASNGAKMGLVDRKGNIVAPAAYDSVLSVTSGLHPASRDGKWGYLDETGKLVIPHMFAWANQFEDDGLAIVNTMDGKSGFIDKTGKLVIPARFDFADRFVAEHAIVKIGNLFGLIDRTGNLVVPAGYMNMFYKVSAFEGGRSTYDDALFVQAPSGQWGVMSLQGKMLIAPKFDGIGCTVGEEVGD